MFASASIGSQALTVAVAVLPTAARAGSQAIAVARSHSHAQARREPLTILRAVFAERSESKTLGQLRGCSDPAPQGTALHAPQGTLPIRPHDAANAQ